jgi:endogenous inhibitor of DNA gyrase (YacG/DUF329 family)
VSARERQLESPGKTAKQAPRRAKCPICGKPRSEDYRPFCSKHCADIDLGRWLDGRYAVPGEPAAQEENDRGEDR